MLRSSIQASWRDIGPNRLTEFFRLIGIAGLGATVAELIYIAVEHFSDIELREFELFVSLLLFAVLSRGAAAPTTVERGERPAGIGLDFRRRRR